MAQKKHKKRHSQDVINAKRQANQNRIADEMARSKNRMNPTARTLLYFDLVFLAIVSMLDLSGIIPPAFSGLCTIIGVLLLLLALWFQFIVGPRSNGSGGPGGRWS